MRKGTFGLCVGVIARVISGVLCIWNGKVALERSPVIGIVSIVAGCILIALTVREVALSRRD
jgi:hypothetical protein